jgi:hypothetical protein
MKTKKTTKTAKRCGRQSRQMKGPCTRPIGHLSKCKSGARKTGRRSYALVVDAVVLVPIVDELLKSESTTLRVNRTNSRVRELIAEVCDELKETLLEKNLRYGNSFAEPIRVFSKASPRDQVLTRLDDKLSRLSRGSGVETEDTVLDVAGYVMLLRVLDRLEPKALLPSD